MYVDMRKASGRAKCRYCRGLIKAGTKCYVVGEFKSEIRLHINLKACERNKELSRLVNEETGKLGKEMYEAYKSNQSKMHVGVTP